MENTEHSVSIEQRKKISATAIESVDAFSERQITLSFSGGRIIVTGSKLKIINFSRSSGAFAAIGDVEGVRYTGGATSLRRKLFR